MFSNPLFIVIIILLIFIFILLVYKNLIYKTRSEKTYFVPVQQYKDLYIEKFTKSTTKKYNSIFGGKEISFKAVKENDGKMNFFVYTSNYEKNNVIEYDIIKNIDNIDADFIEYDNNKIGKEVKIDKPTSIRTCLTNNKNYITSF